MRNTENVLKSFDEAREAQPQGHEHHEDVKRLRTRGEHGNALSTPSPRRQPRRRAAARTGERRSANADPRLTPGATGAMTENSLDLFLRAARAHALLTAEEEVELAKRIERGDLEAKERMINANLRLVVSRRAATRVTGCRWRTWSRKACWA
jgi:RNA polymerase primary sigma factor